MAESVDYVQRPERSRLRVVETVSFQRPRANAEAEPARFGRALESDEEPYTRRYKVGPAGVKLELGWVTACSMLRVEHAGPKASPTVLLQVGDVPVAWIPRGETARFCPADVTSISLSCEAVVVCIVTVYPG